MSEKPSVYNTWVPDWCKAPLLAIAMFPHLMLMFMFSSNSSFTASILDIDSDDLQFMVSIMYAGIIIILLVSNRFFAFIPLRTYLLIMAGISSLILFALSITTNYGLVIPLRIFEGLFAMLEGAIFMPLLISEVKSKNSRLFAYFVMYTIMLIGGTLTSSFLKTAIMDYSYQEIFYLMMGLHISIMALTLFLFNGNRFFPKMPLYQLDWPSCLFLFVCLLGSAFVLVLGRRYYWFDSPYIVYAFFSSVLGGGLFLYRQMTIRRKIFHFEIFKFRQVRFGVLLFVLFYIVKTGVSNIYTVMTVVWQWPWEFVIDMQYFYVVGAVLGVVGSGILLIREFSNKMIFAIGFLVIGISCFWISRVLTTDVTVVSIGLPLCLQGFGHGWIFTPIVMYIINGLPTHLVSNAALAATATRFWTTNIGYSIATNVNFMLLQKNYNVLQSHIDAAIPKVFFEVSSLMRTYMTKYDFDVAHRLTINKLNRDVYNQSLLMSNMQLFQIYMCVAFLGCFFVLLNVSNKNYIKKFKFKFGFYR